MDTQKFLYLWGFSSIEEKERNRITDRVVVVVYVQSTEERLDPKGESGSKSISRPLLVRSCRQIFVSTLCSSRDSSQIKINKKKRSARPLFSFFSCEMILRRCRHPSSNKKNKVSRERRILKKNPIEVRGRAGNRMWRCQMVVLFICFYNEESILIIHRDWWSIAALFEHQLFLPKKKRERELVVDCRVWAQMNR